MNILIRIGAVMDTSDDLGRVPLPWASIDEHDSAANLLIASVQNSIAGISLDVLHYLMQLR